jgi:hypothetical protein
VSHQFKIEFNVNEHGEWNVELQEGAEPKVTYAKLTTQEILSKIGDLLVTWTAQKK